MGAKTKQVASLMMALVLSGTPALLAACALLCVPGTTHAAAGHVAPADSPHTSCCVPERETPPAGHAHHGKHDIAASPQAVGLRGPDASQVSGADAMCCPDSQTVSVASAAIARADGGLLIPAPAVAAAPAVASPSLSIARVGTPHRPLRSPARTPLVLRI